MGFPDGRVTILGIPYTVELTDLPNPDEVRCDRLIDRDAGVLRLQTGISDALLRRTILWLIIREAAQLLSPDTEYDWQTEDAFANLYYGLLKENPGVLAFCAGWSDEMPSSAVISGVEWTLAEVDYCPGYDKNTFGLTTYQNQRVYVRSGIPVQMKRSVLIHELGHAVADTGAVVFRSDEAFLRAVQAAIGSALRDNSDYMKALFDYQGGESTSG